MAKKQTAENIPAPKSYIVLAGFNYGCTAEDEWGTRVEAGPLTVTLPQNVFDDLFAQGVIVEGQEVQLG